MLGCNDLFRKILLRRSIWRAFRFHFGSLAFGSFILALIWIIKTIIAYLVAKIKSIDVANQVRVVVWLLSCLLCIVHCFERFIKFLNKNAYIQIALHSTSFCTSAREAFFLILRNAGRFLALGSIGHVFQFLGKWTIALGATFAGYIILTRSSLYEDELHSPLLPTFVCLIIAYLIAALFMSIYSMACDAILHCFLADEELMKKQERPPSHAPEVLLDFMNVEREPGRKGNKCCGCC